MIWNGKVYRNLEQQVEYLTEYLADQAELTELGIKVIGEAAQVSDIPPDDPSDPYEFGDAYLIGTEPPYTMYIWTRANGNHPEDFWFNVGRFPMPGPKGDTGLGIDDVDSIAVENNGNDYIQPYDPIRVPCNFKFTYNDNGTLVTKNADGYYEINFTTENGIQIFGSGASIRIRNQYDPESRYVKQQASSGILSYYCRTGGNQDTLHMVPLVAEGGSYCWKQLAKKLNDADVNRDNAIGASHFVTCLGERNSIGVNGRSCNGTFVCGGNNVITSSEDALIGGYRTTANVCHQSIVLGYRITASASESAVFGERHTITGTITDGDDNYKTDCRKLLVYGSTNTVAHGAQCSLIGGYENTVGGNFRYSMVNGRGNSIGGNCEWIQIFGGGGSPYGNDIKGNLADSTIFGWANTIYGGQNSSNRKGDNYIFGHDNLVQDPNNTSRGLDSIYLFGKYLKAQHNEHYILGKYNAGNSQEADDVLTVGCGTATNARSDCFGTGVDSNISQKYVRVGNTKLTEAQLTQLLALI